MAKQRLKQLEPSKIGSSKLGFDAEEDGWVFVKKQRVIIVLPSLPLPQPFTVEKPATSQSQAVLRDAVPDMQETTPLHTAVPPLPLPQQFISQKPETCQLHDELRHVTADIHATAPAHTMMSSLPLPQHFISQKPAISQPQAELRDVLVDMRETTPLHTVVPSPSLPEHIILQKPVASQSQAELKDGITDTQKTTPVHTMVPETYQSQAELRADTSKANLVHNVVPFLPVTEHCTLQKPAASQLQAEPRDFVADAHETTDFHAVEPELCPDFTSVDKPEIVVGRDLTARKAPGPRRSQQDCRMDPDRRLGIHRSRTGHKPIRFPKVMCSSVVMDNEKLRVVNLDKKVEKAGGLNKWVGSIGLGREFERMLRGQRMSKFQMANLTMEKLKHMGALAVGPRRKLIHAIRCVYHPHCLRAAL